MLCVSVKFVIEKRRILNGRKITRKTKKNNKGKNINCYENERNKGKTTAETKLPKLNSENKKLNEKRPVKNKIAGKNPSEFTNVNHFYLYFISSEDASASLQDINR